MTFRIEKPGEYRTRDGRKATILGKNPHQWRWNWVGFFNDHQIFSWDDCGSNSFADGFSADDIIGEWKERDAKSLHRAHPLVPGDDDC